MSEQKKSARTVTGKVVSNKMQDTIVVMVERRVKHPVYHKYIKRSTKVHAHAPKNDCQIGDVVVVKESKPISKTKNWVLVDIKERVA